MSSNRAPAPIAQAQINDINGWLRDKLKEYNDRNHAAINRHRETVRQALERDDDVVRILFGGSVERNTYVEGLSDVDALAIVNHSKFASLSPKSAIRRMKALIRWRLPNTEIRTGDLAVTVTYSDGVEMQFLPAIERKDGIRIADPARNRWSDVVHPNRFRARLRKVNQANGGRVIPIIKLAKGLAARVIRDDGEKIQGYHMEAMAIPAFRNYQGQTDLRSMLIHFCKSATKTVLNPIKDLTKQSRYVDEYMGRAGSSKRKRASKNFQRMLNRFSHCKSRRDLERLFG